MKERKRRKCRHYLKFKRKGIQMLPGNSHRVCYFRFFIWLKMFKDAVGKSLFSYFRFICYLPSIFMWNIKNFSAHHTMLEKLIELCVNNTVSVPFKESFDWFLVFLFFLLFVLLVCGSLKIFCFAVFMTIFSFEHNAVCARSVCVFISNLKGYMKESMTFSRD